MGWLASSVFCLLLLKVGPIAVLTSPPFPVMLSSLCGQPVGRSEPPWIWLSWTWVLASGGSLHVTGNGGLIKPSSPSQGRLSQSVVFGNQEMVMLASTL